MWQGTANKVIIAENIQDQATSADDASDITETPTNSTAGGFLGNNISVLIRSQTL